MVLNIAALLVLERLHPSLGLHAFAQHLHLQTVRQADHAFQPLEDGAADLDQSVALYIAKDGK